jgi:hypothetical protein
MTPTADRADKYDKNALKITCEKVLHSVRDRRVQEEGLIFHVLGGPCETPTGGPNDAPAVVGVNFESEVRPGGEVVIESRNRLT